MADQKDKPARSRDSVANTLIVAISLSLVASVLVATAAIFLKPVQERNEALYKQQIIHINVDSNNLTLHIMVIN